MSATLQAAVAALNTKLDGAGFDGVAKFVIKDEGSILVDQTGARQEDAPADVTLSADAETFRAILEGDLNPTAAFMGGRLSIDGDMGAAMRLAGALS